MENRNAILRSTVITGYVWDNEQRTLANVNVQNLNTGFTVQSNDDGYFEIPVNAMTDQLRFSHIGYDYDTIAAGDFNSYIELYPGSIVLPEIVIGANPKPTTKKSDNTLLKLLVVVAVGFGIKKVFFSKKVKTVTV